MPRIDVWDIPEEPPQKQEPLWVGFTRAKLEDRYDVGKQLGQGGFGSVQVVVERSSGKEYACKSIAKRLDVPIANTAKQEQQLENIRREALILRRLRGTLNVVFLEDMFEDEDSVHLVMEWCKGGELLQRINTRHYSERTAASYMRAVLRTLAQCHHLRILHRDIKPGNFMLLTNADNAPVKAIDFGLAVFFDPKKLPRKDLGLEGTPHFMAPEQLSGNTEPASDMWSAGVMAYQLLCGFVPFDDKKNPRAPALSLVWRAILTEEPKFTHRNWQGVSEQAKDFVRMLLAKEPKERPTAKQALAHPWLQGKSDQRTQGVPLARTVVQRLQKFGVENALKRTVLDMIANDLINRHMEQMDIKVQQGPQTLGPQPPPPAAAAVPAPAEAGEASPAAAAAAAAGGESASAVAPPGSPPLAPAVDSSARLRQLAAQDLLLRSAHKHATVHAGAEAQAALRRGQLMGLPRSRPPSLAGAAPTTSSLAAAAAAAAALQQHRPRRSHDLGPRFGGPGALGRSAISITPASVQQDSRQYPPPAPTLQQQLTPPPPPLYSPVAPSLDPPGSPSWKQQRPGSGAQGSATPAAAGGGGSYKGPVKDPASAAAWDVNFMANRMAHEGSGHALQHYAWLLNVGERSLHGVLERSYHAGRHHSPGADTGLTAHSPKAGATGPIGALRGGSVVVSPSAAVQGGPPGRGHTTMVSGQSPPATAAATAAGEGGSETAAGGGSDYLRMLSLVARQRAEHRKYQRLSLDTSGHRQSQYEEHLAEEEAAGAAEWEGDAEGGKDGRRRRADRVRDEAGLGMTPPQEADEDGEEDATGTAGPSAATTGAFSLPVPSGLSSVLVSATSLPPPSPSPSAYHPSSTPTLPQIQPITQPALAHAASAAAVAAAAPAAGATAAAPLSSPAVAALPPAGPGTALPPAGPGTALPPAGPGTALSSGAAARSLKPSIPGLEEADALSATAAELAAAAAVCGGAASSGGGASGGGAGGDARMSYPGPFQGGDEPLELMASVMEAEEEEAEEAEEGEPGGRAERTKRSSLLKKVRKALLKPVKSLIAAVPLPPSVSSGRNTARTSAAGTGTVTPVPVPGSLAKTSCALEAGGTGPLATVSVASVAAPTDERGRGRGAYAAFLQNAGTGTTTPQERSAHGGSERSVHGGRDRSAHGPSEITSPGGATPGGDRSGHGGAAAPPHSAAAVGATTQDNFFRSSITDGGGGGGGVTATLTAAAVPGPAGYAIHTVKAHREPPAAAAASVVSCTTATSATELEPPAAASAQQQRSGEPDAEATAAEGPGLAVKADAEAAAAAGRGSAEGAGEQRGGLLQEELAPALDLLLGDPAKSAELQDVMRKLQYDKAEELSYEQLSEGLQWLGYRLEPSEVEDLLRQATVGSNDGLTASQFIASQVDWRTFQANHRSEWMDCLRRAFEELGGGPGPDGRVTLEQLMGALAEKLPEEEVNLAVQESLMDAAVEADEVDFDAFVRLMRCNSNDSLAGGAFSSELSYDLYDPRLRDASIHGALGEGGHYQPALETVPDDQE